MSVENMNKDQDIAAEIAHLQQLIDTYTNNLRNAQVSAAEHGLNVPVYLQNEMNFSKKQIRLLEEQVAQLTQKLRIANNTATQQPTDHNPSTNGLPLPNRLSNNKTQKLLQTLIVWSVTIYINFMFMNLSLALISSIAEPLNSSAESALMFLAFLILLVICIFIVLPRTLRFVMKMYIRLFKDEYSPLMAMGAVIFCLYVGGLILQSIVFTLTGALSAPFVGMYLYKIFNKNKT